MEFRDYNHKKDQKAAQRIWMECGWLEKGKEETFDIFVKNQNGLVAEMNGEAECFVVRCPGDMRYQTRDLPCSFITAVTTSRIARKQGFAGHLTAELVAQGVEDGALLTTLGMFEQGFYNQLGFGTGSYEHLISFDPSQLIVRTKARVPIRLDIDNSSLIHQSRLNRMRNHGGCNLYPENVTTAELKWANNGFGLGYCDGPNGELTHHFYVNTDNVEPGPYRIWWMSYQNYSQFQELMALVQSLGDQVKLVTLREPPDIHFQDLLKKPFHFQSITEKSKYEQRNRAIAYWQFRISNLEKCLQSTNLDFETIHCNLKLEDPIEKFLHSRSGWNGITGDYILKLGEECDVLRGCDPNLPTLKATVNAFTRMWLGSVSATGLSVTAKLKAPKKLLEKLDSAFRHPKPTPDWDY